MAHAFVQAAATSSGVGVTSSTVQASGNWTAGNKIILISHCYMSGASPSHTVADDQSHTWTQLATQASAETGSTLKVWEANVPSTPAANPTITVSQASGGFINAILLEYSGLDTGTQPDASGGNAAVSASPTATTSGNVSAAGGLGLAVYGDAGYGRTPSAATGFTARGFPTPGIVTHVSSKDVDPSSGATFTGPTNLSGSAGWGAIAIVFKVATGAPPPTTRSSRLALLGVA